MFLTSVACKPITSLLFFFYPLLFFGFFLSFFLFFFFDGCGTYCSSRSGSLFFRQHSTSLSLTHIMKTLAVLLICGLLLSGTFAQMGGMGGMGKSGFLPVAPWSSHSV